MNIITEVTITLVCLLLILGVSITPYLYIKYKSNKKITELKLALNTSAQKLSHNSISLSFNECNDIIDYIVDDIWKNKYFINYRLRELTIIPAMDDEITSFVKEVVGAISDNVKMEIIKYYSYDYMIQKITRKSQMLFIDYTNNFKPSTK